MRGDEVNGRRRERWEQIWNGNLKILHDHLDGDDEYCGCNHGDDFDDDLDEDGDNDDCSKYVCYCKSMLNGERRLENRR